jgi:hypothetical protein
MKFIKEWTYQLGKKVGLRGNCGQIRMDDAEFGGSLGEAFVLVAGIGKGGRT